MKDIIKELKQNAEYELRQIGMTPSTTSNGIQKEHDELHRKKAIGYENAIKILSSKFMIRDRMVSEIHNFNCFDDAKSFYDERIEYCKGGNTDVELIAIIDGINNVD